LEHTRSGPELFLYRKEGYAMTKGDVQRGRKERLEDFIDLAKGGKKVQVKVHLRKEIVKQTGHPEETDDISVEMDMALLIGEFIPVDLQGEGHLVTKVYGIASINETEVDEKIIRNIANERLKMDYKRLKDGRIEFEEKFF
jgi:hypothetical protein